MQTASPEYAAIPQLKELFGFSRAETYRRLTAGDFRAVKVGSRTHVEVESVREFMARRPRATFRSPLAKAT